MPSKESQIKVPPNWGDDLLSDFMTAAFQNSLATFVQRPGPFRMLLSIHKNFHSIADGGLTNPPSFLGAALLNRSHGAYLAATRLVSSGQVAETYPLLRSCLEYALYALHTTKSPELAEVWLTRHTAENGLAKVRSKFSHGEVMRTLMACDERLHGIIHKLYEQTIDFGAHPNERGLSGSMEMEEAPGRKTLKVKYLHGGDVALGASMKATAQVGLGALLIFEKIFSERFRILGISTELEALQKSGL